MEVLDNAYVDRAVSGTKWRREGSELVMVHSGKDFKESLAFVNAVGELAEEMNHHPDIDVRWNKVTLRLSTHSAGGITQSDLELASRIEAV